MPAACRRLLKRLEGQLHLDAMTVTGKPIGETIAVANVYDDDVIRPLDRPISTAGGLAVLNGNLAPDGCVIKPAAAEPRLLSHPARRSSSRTTTR